MPLVHVTIGPVTVTLDASEILARLTAIETRLDMSEQALRTGIADLRAAIAAIAAKIADLTSKIVTPDVTDEESAAMATELQGLVAELQALGAPSAPPAEPPPDEV